MTDATAKFDYSRRTRLLNGIVTALYFLILALILYELDRQHYTGEKEAIIREHFREIFNLPDSLAELAGDVLFAPNDSLRRAAAERLRSEMKRIVDGPTSIFSFELLDSNRRLVENLRVVDPDKPRRLQSWRNCLFLRNFERITDLGVKRERGAPGAGRLVARYTTPAHYPPIEELTRRYWGLTFALVLLWTVGYGFLYRYILRPMHNVTVHLQASHTGPPRLIPHPAAGLEAAYNDMAQRALLQEISEIMSRLLKTTDGPATDENVLRTALDRIVIGFDLDTVEWVEFHGRGDQAFPTRWLQTPAPSPPEPTGNRVPPLDTEELALLARANETGSFAFLSPRQFAFAAALGTDCLLVRGQWATPPLPTRAEGVRLACETILRGLLAASALQQSISEQRSQANISLARCIGHDLTNILASVRLNTMLVRELVARPNDQFRPEDWQILRESVDAVFDTMRLVQDIVDLYSSFGSLKRPEYKRSSLNEIVQEFLAKYQPTTSLDVTFVRELDPQLGCPVVERRLLMLALFNVVTNAMDAFRRMDPKARPAPRIIVRTAYDEARHVFRIEVQDNGPGIRDAQGNLLQRGEIDKIFHHGYSTKSEFSEGFGLFWVQTIVERFHGGRVSAENLPEGGARFVLEIRSMEDKEARVEG